MTPIKFDLTIEKATDRKAHVDFLFSQLGRDPTPRELTAAADYMLWGKDENGLNERQKKTIQMETQSGTWDKLPKESSLDSLVAAPAFSENSIRSMAAVPYKVPIARFDREQALAQCPEDLKSTFIALWRAIDEIDLKLSWYDWDKGRRKTPPRQDLLDRFTPEEVESLHTLSTLYTDLTYLRAKQELVRLRRSQYPLRDIYQEPMMFFHTPIFEGETPRINAEYEVFPLGVIGDARVTSKIWLAPGALIPSVFTEPELAQISDYLWAKKADYEAATATQKPIIDFRVKEHLAAIVTFYNEMREFGDYEDEENEHNSSVTAFLDTFDWYVENAPLKLLERIIVQGKIDHLPLAQINERVKAEIECNHSDNYLATVYHRALTKISEFAARHLEVVSNLFFEEEFRTCSRCGRTFLKTLDFFMRSERNKEGLSCRCKPCMNEIKREELERKK